jgi:hypothetical protein
LQYSSSEPRHPQEGDKRRDLEANTGKKEGFPNPGIEPAECLLE